MSSDQPQSIDEQQLSDAIRGAYAAFRRYRLHDKVEGCPCCVSDSAERQLRAQPLAEIDGEIFGYYVWKAMTTWGDVNDFKHFLPRIVELLAHDPESLAGTAAEIAIGKLAYAKWRSWPDEEQAAVTRFLHAWWRRELHLIREPAFESAADTCLCAIAQAIDDLSPLLDVWRVDASLAVQQNLARFIDWNCAHLLKLGRLSNAFWDERPFQMRTVVDWLLDSRTKESLEAAFFQFTASPASEVFSRAVEKWEWIVNSPAIKRLR